MIRLAPIVDQLKAGGFASVEGLLEFAALTAPPRAEEALFVVPQNERAEPNRLSGVVDQKVAHVVSIVLVLKSAARRPGDVSEQLADCVKRICTVMLGCCNRKRQE